MNGRDLFARAPTVLAREVDGEVLLVPLLREVHELDDFLFLLQDPVALRIWELLARPATAEEITRAIVAEFDVEAAAAADDVRHFLSELVRISAAERTGEDRAPAHP